MAERVRLRREQLRGVARRELLVDLVQAEKFHPDVIERNRGHRLVPAIHARFGNEGVRLAVVAGIDRDAPRGRVRRGIDAEGGFLVKDQVAGIGAAAEDEGQPGEVWMWFHGSVVRTEGGSRNSVRTVCSGSVRR